MSRLKLLSASVLLAALFAAGCSRSTNDEAIATDIKAKFFSDSELKSSNLDVKVQNGVATISGPAMDPALQLKAVKLAGTAAGVTKVNDEITMPPTEVAAAPPVMTPAAPVPTPDPPVVARAPRPVRNSEPRTETARTSPESESPRFESPAEPAPIREQRPRREELEIPSGKAISVRMIDAIDSGKDQPGSTHRASLDSPIVVDGRTVAPAGSDVFVRLANARSAGRVKGRSELELQLDRMVVRGRTYELNSNTYSQQGKSRSKQTATRVGIGAGVGAVIGAIAGGGKGAAIGAAVGGGGAGAYQIFTRGQQIRVPSETLLNFQLESPVVLSSRADR